MTRRKKIIYIIIIFLIAFIIFALYSEIQVTKYKIKTDKIDQALRIALVADTHSCKYKDDQQEIYKLIENEDVDLILMPGDIIDDVLPMETGFKTIKNFSKLAPVYYVVGNHEVWSDKVDYIKDRLSEYGIRSLAGDVEDIEIKGQTISLFGIEDPFIGKATYQDQLENLKKVQKDNLSLLLAHRPERLADYNQLGVDFVFSGHAHGGQWRLPFLLENGLLAPNQGFFPKYTVGVHEIGNNQRLIVSRGLSRESTKIFRFYNRPELVIIDLEVSK